MRVVLLGADGQVGHELRGALACFTDVVCSSRRELDLADLGALERFVADARPALIINAAAYNDVDGAEREPDVARRINAEAVAVLGELAKRLPAALITYSTDFVFDGKKATAYTEDDEPRPLGAYGESKLAGERALLDACAPALILRTSWVYSLRRKSFVSSILRRAREQERLSVVDDQIGNPTFCRDLAQATALLVRGLGEQPLARVEQARGVYHVAGGGHCSRYELACAALELDPGRAAQRARGATPCRSSDYPLPAQRPLHAPLDTNRFAERFGLRLPPWRDALARALADITA
jgi:dTDP-4-dehydrorhamnose reductase